MLDQANAFFRAIEGKGPNQLASGLEGLKAPHIVCDTARRGNQSSVAEEVISWP